MKFLVGLLFLVLTTTQAFAGFGGYSGASNLGNFSYLKCSTGLTCTRDASGKLLMTSSPTLTGTSLALSSTLSSVGNFSVNTSKFTVNATSGNTAVLGDFAIATNKFTVASATGNTVVAGTLGVTGASTLTGAVSTTAGLTVGTTLGVTGNTTLTGTVSEAGGLVVAAGAWKNFMGWKPATLTSGTSTQASATTVYLSPIYIPANATLTGVYINNGATVGTNKYIAALFNSAGTAVANSSLSGITTSGADAYQILAFTGTYAAVGPGVYWVGIYVNGTTDRFRSIPAVGQYAGFTGTATGQTFGTIASITPPTTFTADVGPVVFTY